MLYFILPEPNRTSNTVITNRTVTMLLSHTENMKLSPLIKKDKLFRQAKKMKKKKSSYMKPPKPTLS